MKLTVSCAEILQPGYNFRPDSAFPHETSDVHVLLNSWYKHIHVEWTETEWKANVCGSSPLHRDDLTSVPSASSKKYIHNVFKRSFVASHLERHIHVEERVLCLIQSVHTCSSELVCCAICVFFVVSL